MGDKKKLKKKIWTKGGWKIDPRATKGTNPYGPNLKWMDQKAY